jgi:hypothetical protein
VALTVRRRHCDKSTLCLKLLSSGLTLQQALADEALETARLAAERSLTHVRGGPWCRCSLSADDVAEIAAVQACSGRAAVVALGRTSPAGSLARHLGHQPFQASVSSGARRCILPVKRRSGRSGASTPSTRSGVSGHQARKRKGLLYGSKGYDRAKYGQSPKAARNKAQRKYRHR